jgi:uncharacterized protein YukE
MGDEYLISAGRLHGSAGELQQVGGQFSTGTGALTGSAAIWGADEPGNAFGGAYQQVAQLMSEAIQAVTEGMSAISTNLHTMGGNVESAEQSSTQASGQVGNLLI